MDTVPPSLGAEGEKPAASERSRLREFLAAQERRFTRIEALLRNEVGRLDSQLNVSDEALVELRQQREQLAQRDRTIAQRQGELVAAESRLKQQLVAARTSASAAGGIAAYSGPSSWESEKRRILEALESEAQGEDAIEEGARLKLEEIIQTTDRLVADKGREVAELQSLLASQSGNLGAMAVGAAAVGQLIDQDSVVQQQRETLQRLQDQLMEKLRQAEIEISQERAQLARQSAELDEKRRVMERLQPAANEGAAAGDSPVGALGRGRWLARLGLKDSP